MTIVIPFGPVPITPPAQSLANQDDPDLAWIQETWTGLDPRLPLVHRGMG